jgi:hypothetical protein
VIEANPNGNFPMMPKSVTDQLNATKSVVDIKLHANWHNFWHSHITDPAVARVVLDLVLVHFLYTWLAHGMRTVDEAHRAVDLCAEHAITFWARPLDLLDSVWPWRQWDILCRVKYRLGRGCWYPRNLLLRLYAKKLDAVINQLILLLQPLLNRKLILHPRYRCFESWSYNIPNLVKQIVHAPLADVVIPSMTG